MSLEVNDKGELVEDRSFEDYQEELIRLMAAHWGILPSQLDNQQSWND